jgi:hypothetical protein
LRIAGWFPRDLDLGGTALEVSKTNGANRDEVSLLARLGRTRRFSG